MKKTLVLLAFLTLLFTTISAQWQPTDGIYGADIQCSLTSGTNTFIGTSNGIYLSTNNGDSWTQVNNGLPASSYLSYTRSLVLRGTTIFAGTHDGVYQSTNNGSSWTPANTGLSNIDVRALAISGANIFAGTEKGIYLSTNNGNSWTILNNGLPSDGVYESIVIKGTNIFATIFSKGIYLSTNNGNSWIPVNNGLPPNTPPAMILAGALAINGENLFFQTSSAVYVSKDNGSNWTKSNLPNTTDTFINSLATSGTNVFVGTQNNIYVSTDNGVNWAIKNQGVRGQLYKLLAGNTATILAGTNTGDLFVSVNNGDVWTRKNTGLVNSINTMASDGGNVLFAGTGIVGLGRMFNVFVSTNNGAIWQPVTVVPNSFSMRCLALNGSTAFTVANLQLYSSKNNGSTWTGNSNLGVTYSLAISGSTIYSVDNCCVSVSTNNGSSWTASTRGLDNWIIQSVVANGTNAYVFGVLLENNMVVSHAVFLSTNSGSSWQKIMVNSNPISSIAVNGTKVFVATMGGGVSVSENNGNNWVEINRGLTNLNITSLAVLGANVFGGTNDGSVFISNNNGTDWRAANEGLFRTYISSLNVSGNYLCAGTKAGVFRRPLNEFLTVGTKENQNDLSCTISPNPVSNQLTINCSNELMGKKYAIQNILGETISTNTLKDNTTQVSLNNVANGVYFLHVLGTSKTVKFVKE